MGKLRSAEAVNRPISPMDFCQVICILYLYSELFVHKKIHIGLFKASCCKVAFLGFRLKLKRDPFIFIVTLNNVYQSVCLSQHWRLEFVNYIRYKLEIYICIFSLKIKNRMIVLGSVEFFVGS